MRDRGIGLESLLRWNELARQPAPRRKRWNRRPPAPPPGEEDDQPQPEQADLFQEEAND